MTGRTAMQAAVTAADGYRLEAPTQARAPIRSGEPMRKNKAGNHIEREQRNLIAAKSEQSNEQARRHTSPRRRTIKRARDKPEHERQISEADDLDGVLNARAGGAAERKAMAATMPPAGCQPRS